MLVTKIPRIAYTFLIVFLPWSCVTSDPVVVKPIEKPVNTVQVEVKPIESVPNTSTPGEFIVSEVKYKATFADIDELISKLNKIIQNKQFDDWFSYLDLAYTSYYGDPERLKKLSDSPILKKYRIVVKDLKDFFQFVVVPSRSNAVLDRIAFADKDSTQVVAYTLIEGKSTILYQLKSQDGVWKISYW